MVGRFREEMLLPHKIGNWEQPPTKHAIGQIYISTMGSAMH